MEERVRVRRAATNDLGAILGVLRANADDPSLFQQPEGQTRRTLNDFFVAEKDDGHIVGCIALHRHRRRIAELLALAVHPEVHGHGIGRALLKAAIDEAREYKSEIIWLGSRKTSYFEQFGFCPFSRWDLPVTVLLEKLRLVLQQPIRRWIPAIFGGHVFMKWTDSHRATVSPIRSLK